MLGRVFPKTADNAYRGHWLGIVILAVVAAIKGIQGAMSIVNTRDTAINADGIPLDSYASAPAATVVAMFALLGMYVLVVPLQSIAVLIRWRSLVPFMLLSLLAVQLGGRALRMVREGWPDLANQPVGFWINLALLAVTLLGFALSVTNRKPRVRDTANGAR